MKNLLLNKQFNFALLKFALFLLTTLGWGVQHASAQTSVNSSGGNTSGADGSVSYSIGQVVNNNTSGSTGSVIAGIQIPYEISVISGVEKTDINIEIKAFPNPTIDNLYLKMDLTDQTFDMHYSLIDNSGKVLLINKVIENPTIIPLSEFISGVYYLRIIQDNKLVKTFKIIKNK